MPSAKSRYVPALDGLRAFAVLAVIAYHMGFFWAPGGLLGVTVFFVLSGYLITSLLLTEWKTSGRINLKQFWLRRVRRLFPAIVLVVFCMAALCTLFNHSLLTKLREDMWAALLWATNWWYIFHDVSYFDALGAPSPLTHFWSLAIEEQFYLVWPLVLVAAHKAGLKHRTMRNATLVLAILSALEMALLYNPAADPSRVYYGTDTRAFSLLIGAWLAFVWPLQLVGSIPRKRPSKRACTFLDASGVIALAALLVLVVTVDGFSPFWYLGGTLLTSILTAIVIAVMVHPSSALGRAASAKPLTWIGVRSYGIYLWHYPLILLIAPQNPADGTPWWLHIIQLAAIIACAALSYRFVENPIRKGALSKIYKQIRSSKKKPYALAKTYAFPAAISLTIGAVAIFGLITVAPTSALEGGELLKKEGAQTAGIPQDKPDTKHANTNSKENVLMIGDSVSVRAIPYFEKRFPDGIIDAAVNRQFSAGKDIYQSYEEKDLAGNVVIFALGTNGKPSNEQIEEVIKTVGSDKHILFVNTRSPQSWVNPTNSALNEAAKKHINVSMVNWYDFSAGKGDYFDGDGTHLSEQGAETYINLIGDSAAPYLPDPHDPKHRCPTKVIYDVAKDLISAEINTAFDLPSESQKDKK